jgi:hypothetical protein
VPAPSPRTWTAGETVTAAMMNDLRDALSWLITRPYVHFYHTAAQTFTTGVHAAVTFAGELVDTIGGHSTSVNTSRYTPNVAGKYLCLGMVAYNPDDADGTRLGQFRKNGTAPTGAGYSGFPAFISGFSHQTALAIATIDVNGSTDYIELWGGQDAGNNVATDASGHPSFMLCMHVGL